MRKTRRQAACLRIPSCLFMALAVISGHSLSAQGLNIPAKEWGVSFGNSKVFAGLRFNFRDSRVERVTGINVTLWMPRKDNLDAAVSGLSLGLIPGGGDVRGIQLGVLGASAEKSLTGINIGGLGVGAGDNLTGINIGGIGIGAGENVKGLNFGGLGVGAGEDLAGISFGGLGVGAGENVTGLCVGGLGVGAGGNFKGLAIGGLGVGAGEDLTGIDRKSTRLNSSHTR